MYDFDFSTPTALTERLFTRGAWRLTGGGSQGAEMENQKPVKSKGNISINQIKQSVDFFCLSLSKCSNAL